MPEIVVRTAAPADLDRIGEIYEAASLSNEGDRPYLVAHPDVLVFEPRAVAEGRTRVAAVIDEAAGTERVIGFATLRPRPPMSELDDLFVDPSWMRRGAARRLIDDAVALARRDGLDRIEVTGNVHARAFYEAVGFTVVGEVATRFDPGLRMHLAITLDT